MTDAPKIPPFDLKHLEVILKSRGMEHIEGLAKAAVEGVLEWVEHGVKETDSKVDDFALALIPPFKAFVMSKLEAISDHTDQPAS